MRVTSQGLRPVAKGPSSTAKPKANSLIACLPSSTAPARSSRSTMGELSAGTYSASSREPPVIRTPSQAIRSFSPSGTPCSGPRERPRASSASAARGCSSARSLVTVR